MTFSNRDELVTFAASADGAPKLRALPRPLVIPSMMKLTKLDDVRTLIEKHLPKKTRAKSTWKHVEATLKQAASGGDTAELWAPLQMVLMLEGVEYRLK